MDPVQAFETWKELMISGGDITWWQSFYVKFYQAFIQADRWKEYLQGVSVTKHSINTKQKIKACIHYVSSSLIAKNKHFIKESPEKFLTCLLYTSRCV